MACKSFAALVVLILGFAESQSSAEEIKGKIKSVDLDKATITLEVGTSERVYPVASEARFLGQFGKKVKKATTQVIEGGLKGIKEGAEVTVTTEKRDEKEVVSLVKVEGLQVKEKKKKKTP
jgi:Cu/Ag efflux protein CusF